MFDKNKKMIAKFAGNVILQAREEISVQSVNFNVVDVGIVSMKKRIAKVKQANRVIEKVPEKRILELRISISKSQSNISQKLF